MPDPRPGTEVVFDEKVRRVTVGPALVEGQWAVKLSGMVDTWVRVADLGSVERVTVEGVGLNGQPEERTHE
jgi:hypothetical protein